MRFEGESEKRESESEGENGSERSVKSDMHLEHLEHLETRRGLSGQEHGISPTDQLEPVGPENGQGEKEIKEKRERKKNSKKKAPVLPYSNSDMLCIPNAIRQYTCLSVQL